MPNSASMPKRVSNTWSRMRGAGAPQARHGVASGTAVLLLLTLVQLRVDQEAEPEGLQHEEDQAGAAIEKPQPHDVAVAEQQEGAQEPRQPVVAAAQRALALDRVAAEARRHTGRIAARHQLL